MIAHVGLKECLSEFLGSPMHLHLAPNEQLDSENEVFTVDLFPNQVIQERFKFSNSKSKVTAVNCLQWMRIFKSDKVDCPEILRKVYESIPSPIPITGFS